MLTTHRGAAAPWPRHDLDGHARKYCQKILSSGEATFLDLRERSDPFYASVGNRFLHIGPERDRNLFDGLDWDEAPQVGDCDLVVNTGPWEDGETVADYEDLLQQGAAMALPMICANPDLVVIRGGREIICADRSRSGTRKSAVRSAGSASQRRRSMNTVSGTG